MEKISFKCRTQLCPDKFQRNLNFDIRLWKPDNYKSNNPARGVVVMINGFLEGLERKQNGEIKENSNYRFLAEELIKQNYVVLLLPLPFHFERSLDFPGDQVVSAPVNRLDPLHGGSGSYMFYGGYEQVQDDFRHLIEMIKSDPEKYYLKEKFEIHLLGYSIGGAVSLGLFLGGNKGFHLDSLILLLTNYNIAAIKPEQIDRNQSFVNRGFTGDAWRRFLADLDHSRNELPPEFRFIVWNDAPNDIIQSLKKNIDKSTRILLLNGLKDELFDAELINNRNNEIFDLIMVDKELSAEITLIMTPCSHSLNENYHVARYVGAFIANNTRRA